MTDLLTRLEALADCEPTHSVLISIADILRLVRVARAAGAINESLAPVNFERGQFAELRAAWAELEDAK
jgi:hypothetical protein